MINVISYIVYDLREVLWDSSKFIEGDLSYDGICMWILDRSTFEPFSFLLIFAIKIGHVSKSWDGSLFLVQNTWSIFDQKLTRNWMARILSHLKITCIFHHKTNLLRFYKSLSRSMSFVWQSDSVKLPSMYRIQSKFWSWMFRSKSSSYKTFSNDSKIFKVIRVRSIFLMFQNVSAVMKVDHLFNQKLLSRVLYELIKLIDNRLKWLNCIFCHGGYV